MTWYAVAPTTLRGRFARATQGPPAHLGRPIMLSIKPAKVPMYTQRLLWSAESALCARRGPAGPVRTGSLMGKTDQTVTVVPETLLVCWHWPPRNRASTVVLANLFRGAPAERFRVITRRMPRPSIGDRTPVPPFETHTVPWRPANRREGTPSEWVASVRASLCMMRVACGLHETRPFERVVAVYPHRFSLLAGWWIAHHTGVPLIAYMHDLFAEAYRTGSRLKRAFWRRLDRLALADAALVVVPTAEFAAHYRRRGLNRTLVLPHCALAGVQASPALASKRVLDLVYTGNLYDAHEDSIKAFLAAIDSLSDIRATLYAPPHPMLGGRPARWVSRDGALEATRNADVCVLVLGHDTPYPEEVHGCFPSKMADYLAAGRPILAIVPPGCFVDRFIRETGAGIVVNTLDNTDIHRAIERLRDTGLREHLAEAAARAARRLDAAIHLPRLLDGLASLEIGANDVCAGRKSEPTCQDTVTDMPRVPGDIRQPRVCASV